MAAEQAVEILRQLLEADPGLVLARSRLADARTIQSSLAKNSQQFDESEAFAKMAIDEYEMLAKELPDDPIVLTNWAVAQWQLGSGIYERKLSRWREAKSLLLKAQTKIQLAMSLDKTTTYHELRLVEIFRSLGQICKVTGRVDEAISYMSESVEIIKAIQLKEPSVRSHAIKLSGIYGDLSSAHSINDDSEGERRNLEAAFALLEPLVDDQHADMSLAIICFQLGGRKMADGDLSGSEILLNRGIELAEKILHRSPEDFRIGSYYPHMWEDLAALRVKQGRLKEALENYDRAVELTAPSMRAPTRIARGQIRLQLGDHGHALTEVCKTLAEMPQDTPDHVRITVLKDAAKLCAQCSAAADTDEKLSDEKQIALSEEYAAYAVSLLQQAIEKGFKEIDSLAAIPELEPLREREDFKALGL